MPASVSWRFSSTNRRTWLVSSRACLFSASDDPVAIVYNDDGKLMGLPLNRALWDEDGLMYDVIAGTFLVVGLGEEDFVSLSPELAQKYEEHFHQPEAFLPLGRRLMVIPVPDESVQNDAEKAVSKPPAEHDR